MTKIVQTPAARDRTLLAALDRRAVRVVVLDRDRPWIGELVSGDALSAIRSLTRKGWLVPVRRGAWVVRSRSGALPVSALELVGHLSGQRHLVTGGRALDIRGLSDQAFRRVTVLVDTSQRSWVWLDEEVRYTVVPPKRIWGGSHAASLELTWVATAERALLDSFARPSLGVSMRHAVEALEVYLHRHAEPPRRLAEAAARYENASLARRIGLLVEHLAGETAALPFASLVGPSHATVDLGEPRTTDDRTTVNSRWRVRHGDLRSLLPT